MLRTAQLIAITFAIALVCGCDSQNPANRFGKTFYLDGAGNWGFGAREVPQGLRSAGYEGDIEIFIWTTSLNPLVDQVNIVGAKARAAALAGKIERYRRQFPDTEINIIALSAGTGVATWAIEALPPDARIDNLILLGSSLSHDYDMGKTLSRMNGKIYAYYSSQDAVLDAVRVVGTIDRKQGVNSIGLVGLKPPPGMEDRVVNVGWTREWMKLGWTGAHTDTTNAQFVRYELAKIVLPRDRSSRALATDSQPGEPRTASLESPTANKSTPQMPAGK